MRLLGRCARSFKWSPGSFWCFPSLGIGPACGDSWEFLKLKFKFYVFQQLCGIIMYIHYLKIHKCEHILEALSAFSDCWNALWRMWSLAVFDSESTFWKDLSDLSWRMLEGLAFEKAWRHRDQTRQYEHGLPLEVVPPHWNVAKAIRQPRAGATDCKCRLLFSTIGPSTGSVWRESFGYAVETFTKIPRRLAA